ncbi:MAG: ribonuclease P protein subunit [Thermoproteota archaeon]|jgi:ribonuclease P protein subunit POP4|nr:ribonuclease P protein subunit [Thermoproteota archaeon]
MKLRKDNIIYHELLGLFVECYDKKYKKVGEGMIIDETKETIKVLTKDNKIKKYLKRCFNFLFLINGDKVMIKGEDLLGKPEDRIKKL